MGLDIDFKFYSSIEELEDEFLGYENTPNVFVERLFYQCIPEEEIVVRCNNSKLSSQYMKDLGSTYCYTSINYCELYDGYWNSMVYNYLQYFYQKKYSNCVKAIDEFLCSTGIDFETKKFNLNNLIRKVNYCYLELSNIKENKNVNDFQNHLLNVFIEIYDFFITYFESEKFNDFKLSKTKYILPKRIRRNYFTINNFVRVNATDLRNSLVSKGFVSDKTKSSTIKNAFSSQGTFTKIDWIGGKDRLASFVSLLKEQYIIKGQVHSTAKNIFIIDGKEIKRLRKPKEYRKYKKELIHIIQNHFDTSSLKKNK